MSKFELSQELESLGLSRDEALVFLATLELGGGYASTIAKTAKVPRVNAYHLLEKLKKRRLVTMAQRGRAQFFIPEPPQVLINEQEEKFKRARRLLPELLSLTNTHPFKPKIRTFEGEEGIRAIFDQTLTAKKEILGYTNLKSLMDLLPDYLPIYTRKLVENNIKQRLIVPKSKCALEFSKRYYPKHFPGELLEIFFVNPKRFPFENHISLYDQSVAIVSLNPEEPIGVIIESEAHAKTQHTIFDLAWLGATSFVAQN